MAVAERYTLLIYKKYSTGDLIKYLMGFEMTNVTFRIFSNYI